MPATRFSSCSKSMASLWKWKWVYGVFNPHVHELVPRLHRQHDYLGSRHECESRVDAHMGDLGLPDLAVVGIDNPLHHVEYRLGHIVDVQRRLVAQVEVDEDPL